MKHSIHCVVYLWVILLQGMLIASPYGDMKSSTLTQKAWLALEAHDFNQVYLMTDKCIDLYQKEAIKQQGVLVDFAKKEVAHDYWALNDVATCFFIKAKAMQLQNNIEESKNMAMEVIDHLSFAQAFDPKGDFFWKVASACRDHLMTLETNIDFGDYTSSFLTGKAWESLNTETYETAVMYAQKCIDLYLTESLKQQGALSQFASKEQAFDHWALNDVGTCYFIKGQAYLKSGDHAKALEAFQYLVDSLSFTQCYDPKGFFWRPAVTARGNIHKIGAMSH